MLATSSHHLNSVAENFDVSRPAISKHMKILEECGLVRIKQQGRHRYCELKVEKLHEVSNWVQQYRKLWTEKLDSLENYLSELQSKKKKHGRRKSPKRKR
jgi:DNA-binding transcriptional ArsR family regulator